MAQQHDATVVPGDFDGVPNSVRPRPYASARGAMDRVVTSAPHRFGASAAEHRLLDQTQARVGLVREVHTARAGFEAVPSNVLKCSESPPGSSREVST